MATFDLRVLSDSAVAWTVPGSPSETIGVVPYPSSSSDCTFDQTGGSIHPVDDAGGDVLLGGYFSLRCPDGGAGEFNFSVSDLGDFRKWSAGTFTKVASVRSVAVDYYPNTSQPVGPAGIACGVATDLKGIVLTVTVETATGGRGTLPAARDRRLRPDVPPRLRHVQRAAQQRRRPALRPRARGPGIPPPHANRGGLRYNTKPPAPVRVKRFERVDCATRDRHRREPHVEELPARSAVGDRARRGGRRAHAVAPRRRRGLRLQTGSVVGFPRCARAQLVVTGTSVTASQAAAALASKPARRALRDGGRASAPRLESTGTLHGAARARRAAAVVAIGECGLDFNRDFSPRADQMRAFEAQLELAARARAAGVPPRARRPRHASSRILLKHRPPLARAVVHCFTGTPASCEPTWRSTCTSASRAGSATSAGAHLRESSIPAAA